VYYFHPCWYQGKQDKWVRKYLGPYLVVDNPSPVNVVLQASPRARKFTADIDKVKPFVGDTLKSWLKTSREDSQMEAVNDDRPSQSNNGHSDIESAEEVEEEGEEDETEVTETTLNMYSEPFVPSD